MRFALIRLLLLLLLLLLLPPSLATSSEAPCSSCVDPAMQVNWWENTGLNCPSGGDAGLCDICAGKGNTPEATKACQAASSAEECCAMCMQWNAGHLPGGHKPGNALKCHSWFFRKDDKWCGLKNCDGPGKCGPSGEGSIVRLSVALAHCLTVGACIFLCHVSGGR